MVEGRQRLDTRFQESIDQPVVKVQSGLVDLPATFWQDARPGDGETVVFEAQRSHQLDVFLPAVIMVTRDISVIIV